MKELWKTLKLKAAVFREPHGQWAVRPGAVVWYATEKLPPIETDISLSIDTGETGPTYEGIVAWLEEKARRGVKKALHLDEQETMKLVIESDIRIER